MRRGILLVVAIGFFVSLGSREAVATDPAPNATVIEVVDMCCANCAKRIARKLYAIPGVVAVHADVEKGIAMVSPEQSKQPSPRAMWEAVESLDFELVKIIGPAGEFTDKPPH